MTATSPPWQLVLRGYLAWIKDAERSRDRLEANRVRADFREWALGSGRAHLIKEPARG